MEKIIKELERLIANCYYDGERVKDTVSVTVEWLTALRSALESAELLNKVK